MGQGSRKSVSERIKASVEKRDDKKIIEVFKTRQDRQIVAIAAAMFFMLLAAVIYKRPDLLGAISGRTLFGLQLISIASFLVYTAYNWRCPSCNKHLGGNVHRLRCGKCGSRLQ
jgi:tRNA(Ile2) C34 agmatinyltransferase TiaS